MRRSIRSACLATLLLAAGAWPGLAQIVVKPGVTPSLDLPGLLGNQVRVGPGPAPAPGPGPAPAPGPGPAPVAGLVTSYTAEDALELAKAIKLENPRIGDLGQGLRAAFGETEGVTVGLIPFHCEPSTGCGSLFMFAYFGKQDSTDLNFANAFNLVNIGKLVKLSDGSLNLQHSMRVTGGVSRDNILFVASLFVTMVKQAIEFKPS